MKDFVFNYYKTSEARYNTPISRKCLISAKDAMVAVTIFERNVGSIGKKYTLIDIQEQDEKGLPVGEPIVLDSVHRNKVKVK